jgi:hypothetical protein
MTTKVKVAVQRKPDGVPGWPHINFDYDKELGRVMEIVRSENPDMDFDIFMYTDPAQAEADYDKDLSTYDGVLVLMMTNWLGIDKFYCERSRDGLPVIVADVPFCGSGSVLTDTSPLVRGRKLPVALVASKDYRDIAKNVRIFAALKKLCGSTVLVVKNIPDTETEKAAEELWGCRFVNMTSDELMAYFRDVPSEEARNIAGRWKSEALGVLEPSDGDIDESARLYDAIMKAKEDTGADAVTIDCLHLSYSDSYHTKGHMYPCLSYYQMNNDGLIGVCESDINSTVASMLILYLTGRPGFVSDPVVDTSSDQITYSHCVACRKVFGKDDPRTCQFYIRSHAEDQKGASVQVIFPENEPLTTINLDHRCRWASIHSAVSTGNAFGDAGCRSKLVAKTNASALLKNWMPQWHRVTVFGEYRQLFINLFTMKGLAVTEEDRG